MNIPEMREKLEPVCRHEEPPRSPKKMILHVSQPELVTKGF